MGWVAVPNQTNWEYSNDPNTDRKAKDSYDYDAHSGHVAGIRANKNGTKTYVLCRQVDANVSAPVGFGELQQSDDEGAFHYNLVNKVVLTDSVGVICCYQLTVLDTLVLSG